ncbi:MAG TPA: 4-hydroxyphenylpyruvate dioxygenase [Dongiaceae bacterium]|jgi:4-hydroxyphenylpyruvate dioxygenase|nr:4-hydroxyphenylpyruvate dioxygenase [Dongiaceae bacterium]
MDQINPMGTRGFEFVEFTSPDPQILEKAFRDLGFSAIARHRSKAVTLWRQGNINLLLNQEPGGFSAEFARQHGPSACAMAIRVDDAAAAAARARSLGATVVMNQPGPMELALPAIEGIGGAHIFLIDRWDEHGSIYDIDFVMLPGAERHPKGFGLAAIDHLTNNVYRGRMDHWAGFYERLFNFREIRYFDIEGKLTGLKSRAMTSPDGNIRIPINESADDKSQIEEYLHAYKGEGIQHIALTTDDIYTTVERLRRNGLSVMEPPPRTYYDMLEERLPGHGEDVDRLRQLGILLDGSPSGGLLLQIFTQTLIGPIFFEIIQRKGDEGFGEGNFRALFESIERDQLRRGVLQETKS